MKGISSSVIRCFIKIKTHLNQRVCHLPRQGKANLGDSSLDRGKETPKFVGTGVLDGP